jgi:hypothetical protein
MWMLTTKFLKLLGHFIRYPADLYMLPVSIGFGYLHGVIKVYAMCTLNVVSSTPSVLCYRVVALRWM